MSYATQRDSIIRTRQDLIVLGVRECCNHYAQLVPQLLTRTEEFDHGDWTKTSVVVAANNAYGPEGIGGGLVADTITFDAAFDNVYQVTPEIATSKSFTGSIWLRVAAGSQTLTLIVRNVAGSESTNVVCNITTTWTRFWSQKKFSGGIADAVELQLYRDVADTGTVVEVFGANLYRNPSDKDFLIYFPYVKRVAELTSDTTTNSSRCTIADNGDGHRCFYSRPTCQSTDDFNAGHVWEQTPQLRGIREYRMCRQDAPLPIAGEDVLPYLVSAPVAAQEIDPARAVTVNERATFEFEDDAEPGLWNPRQQYQGALVNTATGAGTFWRRWVAIYRNYANPEGYLIRKVGFVETGATEADFQTRQRYVILNYETSDRRIKLECGDRLKLTRKSIPPKISSDNYVIGPVNTVGPITILTVTDAEEIVFWERIGSGTSTGLPDGVVATMEIDFDTPEAEKCNVIAIIGQEVFVDRGRWGTAAVLHPSTNIPFRMVFEAGTERSSPELAPLGKNPVDIIIELYKYAGLTAADIDVTTLEAERDTWLPTSLDITTGAHYGPLLRRTLTNITDVETLVREIRELSLLFLWVNSNLQLTGKVFAPSLPGTTIPVFSDDDTLIAGSIAVDDNDESRLSRIVVAYNLPDTVTQPRVAEDFEEVRVEIDVDSEEREYYGDKRARVVLSQWIEPLDQDTATYYTSHMLSRFRNGVRVITAQVEVKDDDTSLGDIVTVNTAHVQDAFGVNVASDAYVIKKRPIGDNRLLMEFWDTGIYDRVFFYQGLGVADYTVATAIEKESGYLSDPDGMLGSPLEKGYVIW